MSKHDEIDSLKKELDEAYEQINWLHKEANEGFTASSKYQSMRKEIKNLKLMQLMSEQHTETGLSQEKNILKQITKIVEDSDALCKEHGIEYWEGFAQGYRYAYRNLQDIDKKFADLEAKLAAKELAFSRAIEFLNREYPIVPKEKAIGRRPIPEEQKNRIRSYRRKGFTLKDISEMESVSLGAVSAICRDIKQNKEG